MKTTWRLPAFPEFCRPFQVYFRSRRVRKFYEALGIDAGTSILDVGGNSFFWNLADQLGLPRPRLVVILNISAQDQTLRPGISWVRADARKLPFADRAFDVAFSNSVIEHLETAENQAGMAAEIRRSAGRYWVQTPDISFPIEPHYIMPFMHRLPRRAQRPLIRRATIWGLLSRPNPVEVEKILNELRLIPRHEFRRFFPDAEIVIERAAGIPKSLIAVRR